MFTELCKIKTSQVFATYIRKECRSKERKTRWSSEMAENILGLPGLYRTFSSTKFWSSHARGCLLSCPGLRKAAPEPGGLQWTRKNFINIWQNISWLYQNVWNRVLEQRCKSHSLQIRFQKRQPTRNFVLSRKVMLHSSQIWVTKKSSLLCLHPIFMTLTETQCFWCFYPISLRYIWLKFTNRLNGFRGNRKNQGAAHCRSLICLGHRANTGKSQRLYLFMASLQNADNQCH